MNIEKIRLMIHKKLKINLTKFLLVSFKFILIYMICTELIFELTIFQFAKLKLIKYSQEQK